MFNDHVLVSLDILVPDIDGIQLLRKTKGQRLAVQIMMITTYDYKDNFAV